MDQDIRVAIVEDDPYARDWMHLLAARDWRTQVVAELRHPSELIDLLRKSSARKPQPDLVLLDTDTPPGDDWIARICAVLHGRIDPPRILCTGVQANDRVLRQLVRPFFQGYIIKEEIGYSLAWAIALAAEGKWVITPSVRSLALEIGFDLPRGHAVLASLPMTNGLSPKEIRAARLAILFSLERDEMAHELDISVDWGYGIISAVYAKLGLKDLLQEDADPAELLGHHELIRAHVEKIRQDADLSAKICDIETLAFHLVTAPDFIRLPEGDED